MLSIARVDIKALLTDPVSLTWLELPETWIFINISM